MRSISTWKITSLAPCHAQELKQAQEDWQQARTELAALQGPHAAAQEDLKRAAQRADEAEGKLGEAAAAREAIEEQHASEVAGLHEHLATHVRDASEERRRAGERLAAGKEVVSVTGSRTCMSVLNKHGDHLLQCMPTQTASSGLPCCM